jgi:phosphatidate phosphatase LPIN
MDDLDGGASIVSMSTLGTHTSDAPYSHAKRGGLQDEDTDQEFVSLQDISLEDISPEPARGEMYDSDTDSYTSLSLEDGESGPGGIRIKKYLYQKSLVPTQEQLQGLKLKDGANEVVFELDGCEPLHSQLFVWPETCKVVVTDIEGALAVTKAGVLGFFQSHSLHDGAKDMLKVIERNGYQILYMANIEGGGDTKQLVTQLSGAGLHLPAGPVFKSPDSLIRAFGTERTDIFKAAALRGVRSLFPANHNPFYAAFGTSPSDRAAFSRCEVPEGRIFIVNKKGELMSQNKAFKTSFQDLCVSVEQHFPDLNGTHNRTQDSFNNMQFWKVPLPTIDD